MFLSALIRRVSRFFKDESGNVESALVMIPLIALFLITLQLIVTVNYRNLDLTVAQNRASFQAAQQDIYPEDQVIDMESHDRFRKFRLLVVRAEREIPAIFPGVSQLLGRKKLKLVGASVMEESDKCIFGSSC